MNAENLFTPAEAAAVSEVPIRVVQKAIDEGPLAHVRKNRARMLTVPDLFYLATMRGFDPRLVKLSGKAKEQLRQTILASCQHRRTGQRSMSLAGLLVDFRAVSSQVRSNLSKLGRARRMVVCDPEIRGGEPVIRGTRIPVYLIADMLDQGASEEEILSGYPTLKREYLELARIYARAKPRRGRPPKHPWHSAEAAA